MVNTCMLVPHRPVKRTRAFSSHHVLCVHSLQWVVSLGCLTAQHDAVVAIQHGVGNVAGFSSGRPRFFGHTLQHLRRSETP